jgi:hypothetical protein
VCQFQNFPSKYGVTFAPKMANLTPCFMGLEQVAKFRHKKMLVISNLAEIVYMPVNYFYDYLWFIILWQELVQISSRLTCP